MRRRSPAERTRRRISRRLIPFLFILYIISFLDRVNLSYAGLEMTKELHFSNETFGFGTGIFFLGYVLLEIPGTILVELWSARKWIARIMVTWGFVAALTGLIHTKQEFYWARFLLGVAEAGFFPGVIVYLTHWYPGCGPRQGGGDVHGCYPGIADPGLAHIGGADEDPLAGVFRLALAADLRRAARGGGRDHYAISI